MKLIHTEFAKRFKEHCAFIFSKDIFYYSRIGSVDHYLNGCADVVDDFQGQFDEVHDPLSRLLDEVFERFPDLKSEKIAIYIDFEKAELGVG